MMACHRPTQRPAQPWKTSLTKSPLKRNPSHTGQRKFTQQEKESARWHRPHFCAMGPIFQGGSYVHSRGNNASHHRKFFARALGPRAFALKSSPKKDDKKVPAVAGAFQLLPQTRKPGPVPIRKKFEAPGLRGLIVQDDCFCFPP